MYGISPFKQLHVKFKKIVTFLPGVAGSVSGSATSVIRGGKGDQWSRLTCTVTTIPTRCLAAAAPAACWRGSVRGRLGAQRRRCAVGGSVRGGRLGAGREARCGAISGSHRPGHPGGRLGAERDARCAVEAGAWRRLCVRRRP